MTLIWRCDLQIFSGCVCHLEQLHAQSPFLFPIVFSINYYYPFIDGFFSFQKAQVWPSHSKSNISTTTSATTTLDTPLERSSHCASNDEKYYEKPFQTPKIHSPEWRKSPSENWNRKSNRSSSVEQLWSSFFRQSTAWILAVICCIHFLDVSSYHSNGVSEVAAASHARRSIEREIDQLGHFKRL